MQEQRAAAFRALHEGEPFIVPNPVGRGVGFPFTLTARAENLIRGSDDLDDALGSSARVAEWLA